MIERIGSVLLREGDKVWYPVPFGAEKMCRNVKSGDIFFEVAEIRKEVVEEEYQYFDGSHWVRVTPKKSKGAFKGVRKL